MTELTLSLNNRVGRFGKHLHISMLVFFIEAILKPYHDKRMMRMFGGIHVCAVHMTYLFAGILLFIQKVAIASTLGVVGTLVIKLGMFELKSVWWSMIPWADRQGMRKISIR
ncbi:MAG: hypothetical protein ACE5DM_04150 [Candidatus Nanoarchaeia archaeon]